MSDLRLSGWCTSAPGIRPDQHHDFCRWALCQCPNHFAGSALNKGKVGQTRYDGDSKTAPRRCANTVAPRGLTHFDPTERG